MAFQGKLYGKFISKALNKEVSWVGDNIKCMMCGESYVPDLNAHEYKSSVVGEVSGNGYPVGGFLLTGKSVTFNSSTGVTSVKADDITETGITIPNARYIVVYSDTGNPSTSVLIGLIDFGEVRGVTNGILNIMWDSNGIFQHTYQG